MSWILMPIVNNWALTEQAIDDCLAQTLTSSLLLIGQGVEPDLRREMEQVARELPTRVHCWFADPPLSLSAVWNRALDFVWEVGGTEALVVNNDIHLHPRTFHKLDEECGKSGALFVSAVGVTAAQFDELTEETFHADTVVGHGGPDFSCFLITHRCHAKYRFDEQFAPAFCEDLDYHRRLMLGGDGDRIFSVNVPYLHYASQTLKTADSVRRQGIERQIASCRAYYAKKWGGPVNQETYWAPFDPKADPPRIVPVGEHNGLPIDFARLSCNPTTPELQAWGQRSIVRAGQ